MKLVLGRQNPTFSVTATQLRADITYSKATVSVVIDERGLNKYARDYVNEVDQLTVAFGKGLITTQQVADAITTMGITKANVDVAEPEDAVTLSVGFIRAYADAVSQADQLLGFTIGKNIFDTVEALESITGFAVDAVYEDFQLVEDNADANSGDGLEYTDVKPAADLIGAEDQTVTALGKLLDDSIAELDDIAFSLSKLTDDMASASASEQAALSLEKPFTESYTAEDIYTYTFDANRDFSDSYLTLDALASIGVEKLLTEAMSAVSSGSLRMTDYVDITYLAEDYVGTSITFS